jgi:hypothetical protein
MEEQQTIEAREAALAQREAAFQARLVRLELTRALGASKCRPDALEDALVMMAGASTIEFGADGVAKVVLAGAEYPSVDAAAEAFIASRAYLTATESAAKPAPAPAALGQSHQQVAAQAWTTETQPGFPPPPRLPRGSLEDLVKQGYSAADLASDGWAHPPK